MCNGRFINLTFLATILFCIAAVIVNSSLPNSTSAPSYNMIPIVHQTLKPFHQIKQTSPQEDAAYFTDANLPTACKFHPADQPSMLKQVHHALNFFSDLSSTRVNTAIDPPKNSNPISTAHPSTVESGAVHRVGKRDAFDDIAQLLPPIEDPEIEFAPSESETETSDSDFFIPETTASLDTFYELKRDEEYDEAKEVLQEFLEHSPDNPTANLEMAYLLLFLEEYKESIPYLKKAYELKDNDPEIALQIAYTYDKIGEEDLAIQYYTIAAEGDDPEISKKAQAELDAKEGGEATASDEEDREGEGKEEKVDGIFERKFLEFYADSVYYNRFTNWVFTIDLKMGVSLDKDNNHQVYVWLWQVKDTKSAGGTTPAIFSDNVAIASLGYRYRLVKDKYAFIYANFGEAYDLVYRNRSISRGDFRAGLYFYDKWDCLKRFPGSHRFIFKRVGDVDFNFTYYSRYRYWIGYASWREGVSLCETKMSEINLYCRQFLAFDTKGEFFNNIYEIGPAIEIYPYKELPVKFLGGWVQGYYYRNKGPSQNPYGPRYTDLRFQAVIWTLF